MAGVVRRSVTDARNVRGIPPFVPRGGFTPSRRARRDALRSVALDALAEGVSFDDVVEELGMHERTLIRWIREAV